MESIRNLVHVRVGDRKGLAARIVDVGDDEVVVRPPMDEDGPVVPAVGTPVEVGWITKAGVRWHQAAVVDVADDDGTKLILRFLDEAVRLQRRRAARVKLSLPIDVWVDMNAAPLRGRLLDVGGAALRAEIPAALDVGDVVQIRVAFPGA